MSGKVGRLSKNENPSTDGFIPIVVMTKSSKYGDIGPYCLKNKQGHIMENIWQFSKVYKDVPETKQVYSRWDNRTIWEWPAEQHVKNRPTIIYNTDQLSAKEITLLRKIIPENKGKDDDCIPNDLYWKWRHAGLNNPDAVRYPVGLNHRHKCLYSLVDGKKLDYVEARKLIYLKEYSDLVKQHPLFLKLKKMLSEGKNLLIIEIDGPHEESLDYYIEKYGVGCDFIENNTMIASKDNLEIMLNDTKHAFGHGYCLAACLLDIKL